MTLQIAIARSSGPSPEAPPGYAGLADLGRARLFGTPRTELVKSDTLFLAGQAFYRDGFAACRGFRPEDIDRIVASEGGWAIRNLWGNFILAWLGADDRLFLLRSPLTGPALFHAHGKASDGGTIEVAFTDLALARSLGVRLDRPDPVAIDAYLRYPMLRTPRTAIAGVTEILPGEVARLDAPVRRSASWSPWDYAASPPQRADPAELGMIVRGVVQAWSDRYDRVQLELSGGIDSSIVAASLAGRRKPWRAITMVTAEPDGDERIYARAMTERAGAPLFEMLLPSQTADPISPAATPRVWPGGFGLLRPTDAAFLHAARAYRADAIFSGTAGDGAFGYQTSMAPALDAFHYSGWRAALGAARDQARIADDNIWNALRHGVRGYFRGIRLWPVDDLLLSSRHAAGRPPHPWMDDAERVPPGQRRYGLGLLAIQPFLDGYDRSLAVPKIAPLLSQPLIEFGLGVPSWQWGEGGLNRALAREAFRDDLPDIILERRSKGRIMSMFLPAFEENRERLAAYLLDGWLAAEDLIELDGVAELLTARRKPEALDMLRILQFADIESWARSIVGHR